MSPNSVKRLPCEGQSVVGGTCTGCLAAGARRKKHRVARFLHGAFSDSSSAGREAEIEGAAARPACPATVVFIFSGHTPFQ